MSGKHNFLLFLGPPGSGKGTQAQLLRGISDMFNEGIKKYSNIYRIDKALQEMGQNFQNISTSQSNISSGNAFEKVLNSHISYFLRNNKRFISISAGDVLRQEAKTNDSLRKILASGEFAPEELTRSLMESNVHALISSYAHENKHLCFILDGYPRTPFQLEFILQHWKDSVFMVNSNTKIFEIQASKEAVIDRLQGRYIHSDSGRTYHTSYNPPINDLKDDFTGESLSRREDDSHPDIIMKRFENYYRVSRPMLEILEERGFSVERVPEMNIYDTHLFITEKIDKM